MKTIEEIRRENLALLVDEAGGVGKLGALIGKSQSQVSQILQGSPDTKSKTGKSKEMGSKVARQIEIKLKKDRGWMDHEADDQEAQVFKKLPPAIRAWILKSAVSQSFGPEKSNDEETAVDLNLDGMGQLGGKEDAEETAVEKGKRHGGNF